MILASRRPVVALVVGLVLGFPATPVTAQEDTSTIPLADETDTASAQTAVPEDRAALDGRVEEELQALLSRISGLEGVGVDVDAGLTVLTGEVGSQDARERASDVAQRFEGVSFVDNRIEVSRSLRERLAPARTRVEERISGAVATLPLLVAALGILLLFGWASSAIGRLDALYVRLSRNVFVQTIFRQILRTVVFVTGLLLALELLDATALVGALIGTAGVAGIAIGFAFKDIVENYLAGVLLSLRRPFEPNDHVVVDGWEGKVARLTSREAILIDLSGNHVRIPNATVFRSVLVNYTRNPRRRFDFTISVGPEEDLRLGQETGLATLNAMPGVMHDPGPSSRVVSVGDSSVTLQFLGWVDQGRADFVKVRSEAVRLVKTALEEAGVGMPPPAYDLTVRRAHVPARGRRSETPATEEAAPHESDASSSRDRDPVDARRLAERVSQDVVGVETLDVSVDHTIDDQVDDDRRLSTEADLLEPER